MVLGGPFSTGVDIGATDTGWVGSPGVVSGGDVSEGAWDSVEGLGWCGREDLAALDWSVPASDLLYPELIFNLKLPVSVHLSWEWDSSFDQ